MYDIDYETYSKHPWRDKGYQISHIVVEEGITRIGDCAFLDGCWDLESIQIADSVTSIGRATFPVMGEGEWTDVEISENVQDIGWGAFRGNVRVWIADNNPSYCSDEMGSLYDKNKNELLHVSSQTQGRFTVPDTVKTISDQAFVNCRDLTDIELPASLENMSQDAFMYCSSLIGIWINESNPYYVSDSCGVVYTEDMAELYIAPQGLIGSYAIPQTVTRIWWDSFRGCSKLTEVILPDGITKIEDETFRWCVSLSEITIPSSVTEIDVMAFDSCGISKITFAGDAPAIGEIAFYDVTATAYYPAGNKTWTADVMQDYGGTITWVPCYEIIEGADSIVASNSDSETSIHIDGEYSKFTGVLVDDVEVDPSNYNVTEGSTIVTFDPDYLSTLGVGEHSVTIQFTNGVAITTLTIADVVSGDVNGDGIVDSYDATLIMKYDVGMISTEGLILPACDVNGDGIVDSYDATLIQKYDVGMIEKFPVQV